MKIEKGTRIGAARKIKDGIIELFGFGEYCGDEIPPEDSKGERGMIDFVHHAGVSNPKLKMDDGTIIWGAECWWGSEETVNDMITKNKLKIVKTKPKYEI